MSFVLSLGPHFWSSSVTVLGWENKVSAYRYYRRASESIRGTWSVCSYLAVQCQGILGVVSGVWDISQSNSYEKHHLNPKKENQGCFKAAPIVTHPLSATAWSQLTLCPCYGTCPGRPPLFQQCLAPAWSTRSEGSCWCPSPPTRNNPC